jgi:hypothetical protein
MGRGRQKAKQTKVARELKYYSPDTDYDALQKELGHHDAESEGLEDSGLEDSGPDSGDEYADWATDRRR